MKPPDEKYIHRLFVFSLILKGLLGFSEIVCGVLTFFISQELILKYVEPIAYYELDKDPDNFIANHLLQWAKHFSVSSKHFASFYLVSHGMVKVWLVIGLLRDKLWYFPTALVIFGFFISYQFYRFSYTHSILLMMLTTVDMIILVLIWLEYRNLKNYYSSDS